MWVAVMWVLLAVVVPPTCLFFVVCSCLFVVCLSSCCWVAYVVLDPVAIWLQGALPGFAFCFEFLVILSSVFPLGSRVASIRCPDYIVLISLRPFGLCVI